MGRNVSWQSAGVFHDVDELHSSAGSSTASTSSATRWIGHLGATQGMWLDGSSDGPR